MIESPLADISDAGIAMPLSAAQRGVYLAPSAYEAGFMSSAHDGAVIAQTLDAARQAFKEMAAG